MASVRKKVASAGMLGMFFLEKGKVLTQVEYRAENPVPLRVSTIKKLYGNWNKAIRYLENSQPDLWVEIQGLDEPDSDPAETDALQKMADALKSKPAKEAVEED